MSEEDRQRWNTRYRAQAQAREPSAFLRSLAERLPTSGRALDVAGGAGHDALWLAGRGLDVTLEDGELPRLLQGLEVLSYTEGWTEEGRHEARLVAAPR